MGRSIIDLTGETFGELVAIKCIGTLNTHAVWLCLCSCGNYIAIKATYLRAKQNPKTHCGCLKKEILNIIGKRFNRLLVLKKVDVPNRRSMYECVCLCGEHTIVSKHNLIYGKIRSCGCLRKEIGLEKNLKDLTGQKFGRLTVLSKKIIEKNGRKKIMWDCLCSCGNRTLVEGYHLRRGDTQSCGCFGKERRIEAVRLPKGEAAFNSFYSRYKSNAKKRGFEFNLTKDEFRKLVQKPCFYCDNNTIKNYLHESKKVNGGYKYISGVDRVDNTKGYSIENCVPACSICNIAKHHHSPQEFLIWLKHILENIDKLEKKFKYKGLLDPSNNS